MNSAWANLAWRSLPLLLVLGWFLALIGGLSAGGFVHLLLLAGVVVFGYQVVSENSA